MQAYKLDLKVLLHMSHETCQHMLHDRRCSSRSRLRLQVMPLNCSCLALSPCKQLLLCYSEAQLCRIKRSRAGPLGQTAWSKKVVRSSLLGWDASCALWSGLKHLVLLLQVVIKLQNGCHIATPAVCQRT